jgi:hypothetical protein
MTNPEVDIEQLERARQLHYLGVESLYREERHIADSIGPLGALAIAYTFVRAYKPDAVLNEPEDRPEIELARSILIQRYTEEVKPKFPYQDIPVLARMRLYASRSRDVLDYQAGLFRWKNALQVWSSAIDKAEIDDLGRHD